MTGVELKVGLWSTPYLADHAVRDVVMLPGAFFVDVAGALDRERAGPGARLFRNVVFQSPVILASDDTAIRVAVRELDATHREYRFHDDSVAGADPAACVARLEIEIAAPASDRVDGKPIDDLKAQAGDVITAERFYAALRESGNQYGPAFQRITGVWRSGSQSLCRLSAAESDSSGAVRARTTIVDAMAQTLASQALDTRKTFVLRSIDHIAIADTDAPASLWARATLDATSDVETGKCTGAVDVFDESGAVFARLSGVGFMLLDAGDAGADARAATIAVAANITAEPIEDSLRFWGEHFGMPVRVEFAPYNQVFQQLLDPASALRSNRDGINVILLALEEWATAQSQRTLAVDSARVARALGTRPRHRLPNGLEVAHLNQYETEYVYKEVFEDQAYLRHGVRFRDGDTVIDIGANIGLFSLFVMTRCNNPRIIAFEPAPTVYDLLNANCAAYGSNVRAVNAGVAGAPGTATFTFYEKSSVFSGFHVDAREDREAIEAVVRNTLNAATSGNGDAVESYVAELTADRLRQSTHECRMTSVSEIIREHKLDRIDLLKVDAERSELEIIRGIEEQDWPKIGQIVMEVHDRSRAMIGHIEALLTEKGFRCAVEHEDLLEHSGLFNVYATRDTTEARTDVGALQQNVGDLAGALTAFMAQTSTPLVLCVCPPSPRAGERISRAELDAAERALVVAARAIPNVHAIASADAMRRYPVAEYYDAHTHQLGHIPYTPAAYAAIGSEVFRAVARFKRTPFKAVVVDCDNTLWKGVCAEDGPDGVEITPAHAQFQRFLVDQANAGMLVCLCSKNTESDVLEVFGRRNDMVLKREHLVSWRINWNGKSENIKAIARELSLGLDSLIFIDDNPVECAEVRHNCPAVLTLQLPDDATAIGAFLEHAWAFDRNSATAEDRTRTQMYRQNAERERFRDEAMSLGDFVKGLQLRVDIAPPLEADIDRVSQLTYRTNQFNFTTIRRSVGEVREFLARADAGALAVRVADRFGDYGLVGVVMYERSSERFRIDTFLLSCRVLGRGVEHAVLAHLAQRATDAGATFIDLEYRATPRNAPAKTFVDSLAPVNVSAAGVRSFLAADLVRLEYGPASAAPDAETEAESEKAVVRPASAFAALNNSASLSAIAERLRTTGDLVRAIEDCRVRRQPVEALPDGAPADPLDGALLRIWRHVLGRPRIGLNDNFFEAGGTSLKAVQVLAAVKKELGHSLSIVSLFESPTVSALAQRLRGADRAPVAAAASDAMRRGQQRRHVRRTAS